MRQKSSRKLSEESRRSPFQWNAENENRRKSEKRIVFFEREILKKRQERGLEVPTENPVGPRIVSFPEAKQVPVSEAFPDWREIQR